MIVRGHLTQKGFNNRQSRIIRLLHKTYSLVSSPEPGIAREMCNSPFLQCEFNVCCDYVLVVFSQTPERFVWYGDSHTSSRLFHDPISARSIASGMFSNELILSVEQTNRLSSWLHTEWKKAIRRTLGLPPRTRSKLLPQLDGNQSFTPTNIIQRAKIILLYVDKWKRKDILHTKTTLRRRYWLPL